MSKFFRISMVLLVCTALATPALALQADFKGFLQVRGFTYDNLDGNDDADDNASGFDQRFRLWTNAALNEDVKAVFGIEVDNAWGDTGVGRVGADATGQIEIKHLHLDFNVPWAATNVKAGAQYFRFGGGFIQGDDASGIQVRYTPVPNQHSILFGWVKANEGDVFDQSAESDYFHLQYDAGLGGWKLSPFIGYLDGRPTGLGLNSPARIGTGTATAPQFPAINEFSTDFNAYYVGLEGSGKIGAVAVAFTAMVNQWDNDVAIALPGVTADDGMGLALWAKGTYALGSTLLSAEAAYYGDDEAGQFIGVRGYNNFSEMVTGGRFDTRSTMGGNTTATLDRNGNVINASYYMNYMYAKLGAEHKINDKHKVSAFYVYTKEAEDTFNRDAITFGHELDAYYDYAITKGLTFSAGGGYLLADDDFVRDDPTTPAVSVGGDNAWKVGTALTYQF